jgi:hypothetical protein
MLVLTAHHVVKQLFGFLTVESSVVVPVILSVKLIQPLVHLSVLISPVVLIPLSVIFACTTPHQQIIFILNTIN